MRPHRRIDIVERPDAAVGEADLAPHRATAAAAAHAHQFGCHPIAGIQIEFRIARGNRVDQPDLVMRVQQLLRDAPYLLR